MASGGKAATAVPCAKWQNCCGGGALSSTGWLTTISTGSGGNGTAGACQTAGSICCQRTTSSGAGVGTPPSCSKNHSCPATVQSAEPTAVDAKLHNGRCSSPVGGVNGRASCTPNVANKL